MKAASAIVFRDGTRCDPFVPLIQWAHEQRHATLATRLAETERLRERLRIAREMHDGLGRRLSLAAVQAAALEVSGLPAPQQAAMTRLATAIRASAIELHEILGVLRGERVRPRGMSAADGLIEEFRAAGTAVSALSHGTPLPLLPQADEAAYRVVEEGLTNAIRHAPGRPVSVTIAWEAGTLQLTVVNAADRQMYTPGFGLTDLAGRLRRLAVSSATNCPAGSSACMPPCLPYRRQELLRNGQV